MECNARTKGGKPFRFFAGSGRREFSPARFKLSSRGWPCLKDGTRPDENFGNLKIGVGRFRIRAFFHRSLLARKAALVRYAFCRQPSEQYFFFAGLPQGQSVTLDSCC